MERLKIRSECGNEYVLRPYYVGGLLHTAWAQYNGLVLMPNGRISYSALGEEDLYHRIVSFCERHTLAVPIPLPVWYWGQKYELLPTNDPFQEPIGTEFWKVILNAREDQVGPFWSYWSSIGGLGGPEQMGWQMLKHGYTAPFRPIFLGYNDRQDSRVEVVVVLR